MKTQPTPRRRGGYLLALALKEKGIEHVFTLAGGFCNPALEGFMELGVPVINCPHEQVAGHLADGHARLTRKPAVCLIGPEGFANAVPAMMEAWGERSPVIFVTGSSTLKRRGSGGFKEIDDVAIAAPLTKYSYSITDGTRISEFVDRAWKIATSGYGGPVHLSLPFSPCRRARAARLAGPCRASALAGTHRRSEASHADRRTRCLVVRRRATAGAGRQHAGDTDFQYSLPPKIAGRALPGLHGPS